MEKLNVAVADDNERMVEVLGQIIEEDADLKLVGKAHNGEELCNLIQEKEPDVVVHGYYYAEDGLGWQSWNILPMTVN